MQALLGVDRMPNRTTSRSLQLAGQILELVRRNGIQPGERLFEHRLAHTLGVSRGPVRSGLQQLAEAGIATAVPNKGFVLARAVDTEAARGIIAAASASEDQYMQLADDRLEGRLPDVVSEKELMRRYDLGRPEVLRLLDRIASEGWVERLPGYGWRFAETLSSPDAYNQMTRFRMMIEPAGIREPSFRLSSADSDRVRHQQERVLDGGLEVFTAAEIFRFGCEFHESIARASGNSFLLDTLRRLNSIRRLFAYRSVIPNHAEIERQAREHLMMLDLIGMGKREEAAEFMATHLSDLLSSPLERVEGELRPNQVLQSPGGLSGASHT